MDNQLPTKGPYVDGALERLIKRGGPIDPARLTGFQHAQLVRDGVLPGPWVPGVSRVHPGWYTIRPVTEEATT